MDTSGTIQESDLIMPPEAAPYVAEFFIRDMIATGQTAWDETTAVVNTVTMYDETGETPTAYSVELTSGYVIVSAYVDVPNPILEWADEAEPVYAGFSDQPVAYDTEGSGETKVVYLGTLNYLLDTGNDTLGTVEGIEVDREALTNQFDEIRDIANVPDDLMELLEDSDGGVVPMMNGSGEEIDSPSTYASIVYKRYGSTWKCQEFVNAWEAYKSGTLVDSDVPSYINACFPISLTNTIKLFFNRWGTSSEKNRGAKQIFGSVASLKNSYGRSYYINSQSGGVLEDDMIDYAKAAFKNQASSLWVESSMSYITSSKVVNTLASKNKVLLCSLYTSDNQPYGRHAVVGYAYTTFVPQNSPSGPKYTFLKLCDGWSTGNRFLDISTLKRSTCVAVGHTSIS